MLKGHTKIILTDVTTGKQEVHDDDNLVTVAIDRIINITLAMNIPPNDYLLPIATKLLGGIMLFDDTLTEDVDNIHFPVEAHLVGYSNRSMNAANSQRGSFNSAESGRTATGYVSTWDFGTSQANGTIKSVALTSVFAGRNPLRYFDSPLTSGTQDGAPAADNNWVPIRYDGDYLYMLKGDSSTHIMRLARTKVAMLRMGVSDYSDEDRTYEIIASWNTEIFSYTYRSGSTDYSVTVYADRPIMYEDGQDGFFYCVANGPVGGRNTSYNYDFHYFTIKYSDSSYDKSETMRYALHTGDYAYEEANARFPERLYGHINHGFYYKMGSNRKTVHIIPLNNPSSYTTVRLCADETQDYVISLMRCSPVSGGVYVCVMHYTATSSEYRNGFLYPDGVCFMADEVGDNNDRSWGRMCTIDPCLTMWYLNAYSSTPEQLFRGWTSNYLGTINNLETPIIKTAAHTMKVVYTLTDVDE